MVVSLTSEYKEKCSEFKIFLMIFVVITAAVTMITGIEEVVFFRYIDG